MFVTTDNSWVQNQMCKCMTMGPVAISHGLFCWWYDCCASCFSQWNFNSCVKLYDWDCGQKVNLEKYTLCNFDFVPLGFRPYCCTTTGCAFSEEDFDYRGSPLFLVHLDQNFYTFVDWFEPWLASSKSSSLFVACCIILVKHFLKSWHIYGLWSFFSFFLSFSLYHNFFPWREPWEISCGTRILARNFTLFTGTTFVAKLLLQVLISDRSRILLMHWKASLLLIFWQKKKFLGESRPNTLIFSNLPSHSSGSWRDMF